MLGFRLSQKSSLWPLIILFTAGWMMMTWTAYRPTASEGTRALVRTWLDRSAAAYDYAARIPGDSAQAKEMKQSLLVHLPSFWEGVEDTGLSNDTLHMDWSIICLRIAEDYKGGEQMRWRQLAKEALEGVTTAAHESEYYKLASAAADGKPATTEQQSLLRQWLADSPASWSLTFAAWKLDAVPSPSTDIVTRSGRQAYTQLLMSHWFVWVVVCFALLLLIPAWLLLRQPQPRRKHSERLQKLWPLALTLCLISGTSLASRLLERSLAGALRNATAWGDFVRQAGMEWSYAVWQMIFLSSLCLTPWITKAGLAGGWGSTWNVLGIEWKDFIRPRYWFIGAAAACFCTGPVLVTFNIKAVSGWGSNMLDAASRWPFGDSHVYTLSMVFLGLILAPLVEELVFRGYLLAACRQRLGTRPAVWLTAALFSACHAYSLQGTLTVLATGLVLGWLRLRSGRLSLCIITHSLINAVCFLNFSFWNFG